jgi:hypothetical protein
VKRLSLQRHARDAGASNCSRGYTIADLSRLLDGGDPIEAYCEFCDEFWAINVQKRVELSEFVAVAWGDTPPTPAHLKTNNESTTH